MAEIKDIMNPNKLQPLMDITPTKNICPDHDDDSWIVNIPEELEPDLTTTCWIYRVPINLRQVNEAAYTPQLVSIGPFHHGKPKFKSMERHKIKYRKQFWERGFCRHIDEKNVVEAFMKHEGRIERILRCYAATFELAEEDPVKSWANVILTDACFIFELMLRKYESKLKGELEQTNDYILRTPWVRKRIELDLMLLENQLPFFVFTELFDFILDSQPDEIILHDAIPHYLSKRQNESERRFSLVSVVTEFFLNYYSIGKPVDDKSTSPTPKMEHTATGLKRSTLAGKTRVDPAQTPPTEDLISDLREPLATMKRDKVPNSGSHDHVRKEKCVPESRMNESPFSNAVLFSPSPSPAGGRGGGPISESDHVRKENVVPQFCRMYESPLSNAVLFTPSPYPAGGRRGVPSSESDHVRKEKSVPELRVSEEPFSDDVPFTPPGGRGVGLSSESHNDMVTGCEDLFSDAVLFTPPGGRGVGLSSENHNVMKMECEDRFSDAVLFSPPGGRDVGLSSECHNAMECADLFSDAVRFSPPGGRDVGLSFECHNVMECADLFSDTVRFSPPGVRVVGLSSECRDVMMMECADTFSDAVPFTPPDGRDVGPISESDHVLQETKRQDLKRFMTSKHFTDLLRKFFCPEKYEKTKQVNSCLHTAKKLDRAGIKFEARTNAHLADIVYEKPCMSLKVKVPKFTVKDDTECLMRNVMALEQCLYPWEPYICNYIALLDKLIDTAEDVELLIEKHIARNLLGSNEAVAAMVNKLCDQIVVQTSCYVGLCKELNDNYKNCWSISMETLKRVYFKDLWTGSSTFVGIIVTLFSVVSVISTIKSLISG